MTKADLVEQVTASIARTAGPMISKKDCARVVDAFLEAVKEALKQQHNIEVRGFGTFKIRNGRPAWRAIRARAIPSRWLRDRSPCSSPVKSYAHWSQTKRRPKRSPPKVYNQLWPTAVRLKVACFQGDLCVSCPADFRTVHRLAIAFACMTAATLASYSSGSALCHLRREARRRGCAGILPR